MKVRVISFPNDGLINKLIINKLIENLLSYLSYL